MYYAPSFLRGADCDEALDDRGKQALLWGFRELKTARANVASQHTLRQQSLRRVARVKI